MRVAANEDEFEFQFNMAQRESAMLSGMIPCTLNVL